MQKKLQRIDIESIRISNYRYIADIMAKKARSLAASGAIGLKWLRQELEKAPAPFREYFLNRFAF